MTLTTSEPLHVSDPKPDIGAFLHPVRPQRLHQFFERSVDRFPDAIAVEVDGQGFSYEHVEREANQLAHYLRRRGVRDASRVGIVLPRSLATYVALLAVGKARAAFVPIDPASPGDRVAYIARDAELDVLITTAELAAGFADVTCAVLVIDESAAQIGRQPGYRPYFSAAAPMLQDDGSELDGTPARSPECYVIYTSGSSGRPKGVAIAQSSICNFITIATEVYDVRPTDRVYQGMTISFDFSIEEIWPTFAAGATLIVGPTDSRRLGAELADFLDETAVTVLYCVPTLLATILRDLPRVRSLMVGGEACPAGIVERWSRPGRRMLNTYGPTECTVTATWGELLPGRAVTIGRPMPTYSVVVLDERCNAVADGEVGEICIGGPGVAIGYLNLAEKTADRFITFRGERIYRTGDLGCIDPTGEVVYLGRADDEVKIRGHRVDLGEIESILLDDHDVESACAAMVRVGETDELVAYVTRRTNGSDADDRALIQRTRALLRDRVPDYMMPAYFEILAELPTSAAGKVNRRRLPPPSGDRVLANDDAVVPPAGATEELVGACWAEAFGLPADKLSVTAEFFADLGGHSLLAARCVSLLRMRGIPAAVRDVYGHPTVRSLAAHLDSKAPGRHSETDRPATPDRLRPSRVRYSWAGSVQASILYALLLPLTFPVGLIYTLNEGEISIAVLSSIALTATVVYLTLRWVGSLIFARLLSAGLRPGRYPLWGATHIRLWALDLMLALAPLPVLSGSPLMARYLRLLGCRVGSGTYVGTSMLSVPTLIRIGAGASIGYGVSMRPWSVDNGWVLVAPINVGSGTFVGSGAVLEPGASIGRNAVLAPQSLAGAGPGHSGGRELGRLTVGSRGRGGPDRRRTRRETAWAEMDRLDKSARRSARSACSRSCRSWR